MSSTAHQYTLTIKGSFDEVQTVIEDLCRPIRQNSKADNRNQVLAVSLLRQLPLDIAERILKRYITTSWDGAFGSRIQAEHQESVAATLLAAHPEEMVPLLLQLPPDRRLAILQLPQSRKPLLGGHRYDDSKLLVLDRLAGPDYFIFLPQILTGYSTDELKAILARTNNCQSWYNQAVQQLAAVQDRTRTKA